MGISANLALRSSTVRYDLFAVGVSGGVGGINISFGRSEGLDDNTGCKAIFAQDICFFDVAGKVDSLELGLWFSGVARHAAGEAPGVKGGFRKRRL